MKIYITQYYPHYEGLEIVGNPTFFLEKAMESAQKTMNELNCRCRHNHSFKDMETICFHDGIYMYQWDGDNYNVIIREYNIDETPPETT